MRIGIVIGRIGGVDGVALETEKWIEVMQRMGHEVYVLSGEIEDRPVDHLYETHYPLLSFHSAECEWEQDKAFFNCEKDPDRLLSSVERWSDEICKKIVKWVSKKDIEVLISQNASALPCHLSMGVGIKKAVQQIGIPVVTHDHDFHWERGDRYTSDHKEINDYVDEHFPLRLDNVKHVVINEYNKGRLKDRFGIDAVKVPNVMDFNKPYGRITDANQYFGKDIGLRKKDIGLFQITRIVRRKGIEAAIELVHKLDNPKVKLVITGNHNDDEGAVYFHELVDQIHDLDLAGNVIFADKMVRNHSDLGDAYAHARACTYFSTYEGFGNAFVECVLSRTPIFVNDYKPVYMPDIGVHGFKTVMLEDNVLTDEKVKAMEEILYDEKMCADISEYNFELGKKHFSYEVLETLLRDILTF